MFQLLTVFSIFQLLPIAFLLEGKKMKAAWKLLETNSISPSATAGGTMLQKLASKSIFNKLISTNEGVKQFVLNMIISGLSFSLYNEV